jgi:hypothetical protein
MNQKLKFKKMSDKSIIVFLKDLAVKKGELKAERIALRQDRKDIDLKIRDVSREIISTDELMQQTLLRQ